VWEHEDPHEAAERVAECVATRRTSPASDHGNH
jgi:hypothetical protein